MEETQRYFFSAASHELKTPIAATGVLLEGMLENVGDYKDHPKYLRECMKMMDAQSKMIFEILEIVSLNDGKVVPVPEKLDIRNTVAKMLPDFQTLSEANGQRIVTDIPDGQTCLADSRMLQKALSNILLNAVQNTPGGGEIRIWSEPVGGKLRLCVLNTGARIDDGVLSKLFDPFYRVDKARSRKSGRSGLGLTIVRKTLELMNITMLTLIGLTNVISTISTNVRSRAREFAVLRSVGMTTAGLKRMLNLESILCSVKSLMIGVPLGITGSYLLYRAFSSPVELDYAIPWMPIVQCTLGVIAVTWVTMRYSMWRLDGGNIVETIRWEL